MKIKQGEEELWKTHLEANSKDPYSASYISFTQQWAEEMEKKLEAGATMKEAYDTWKEVNKRPGHGMTGFMFGGAASTIVKFLPDELAKSFKKIHNKDMTGSDEEREGVVNPALVTVTVP